MKKRLLSLVLSIGMISTMCSPALATEASIDVGFDTLSLSMDDYLAQVEPSHVMFINTSNDSDLIRSACESFLAIGRASVRDQSYTLATLVDNESINNQQLEFRLSEYQYLAALYEATNTEIFSDELKFSDFEVDIQDDTAVASIVEKYTYYTNDFDGYNFRMRKYTFDLEKQNDGGWAVCSVVTDDPWETSDFTYEPYDIAQAEVIANAVADLSVDEAPMDEKIEPQASSLYKWTYDPDVAVEYAKEYCDADANGGYNTLFPFQKGTDDEGNNCQNFASQCVWAGLIGSMDAVEGMESRDSLPAVSSDYLGKTATNVWCYDELSGSIGYCSWYSSRGFAEMIRLSKSTTEGPFGNTHYGTLKYADVGSVIHYTKLSTPKATANTIVHAMFVTAANGEPGSRTMSDLKIAANSSHTNTAYVPLTSYAGSRVDEQFSTSVISCGYYASRQNFA